MNRLKQVSTVYVGVLTTYLIADFIWLGIVSTDDYTSSIGHLMRDESIIWPWVAFYTLFSACIVRLAIFNGAEPRFSRVVVNAAVLGFAGYGAYNLTNYAIIATWPLSITISDWTWGTFVSTLSAAVGYSCLLWTTKNFQNIKE